MVIVFLATVRNSYIKFHFKFTHSKQLNRINFTLHYNFTTLLYFTFTTSIQDEIAKQFSNELSEFHLK